MQLPRHKKNLTLAERIHIVIEGTDTPAGRFFDVVLLIGIALSVVVVMLDSVLYLRLQYGTLFLYAEWFFIYHRIFITPILRSQSQALCV